MSEIKPLRERIPPIKDILDKAIDIILKRYKATTLSELSKRGLNASKIAILMEKLAESIYREEERKAVKSYLIDKGLKAEEVDKFVEIILHRKNFTRSISNIRRSRAGRTSEEIIMRILRAYGIPCERGKRIKGYRPDLVVPDNETLLSNPEKSVPIAIKRTLRERWAEDIDIFNFPNGKFILLTPDPDFNENKARDMVQRGMKEVYIPDELYEASHFLKNYPQFKKFSQLFLELKKKLGKNI